MKKFILADANEWISQQADKSVDHIITDHPYGLPFPLDDLIRITRGHIITFCDPKRRPFELREKDEIAYWIKPLSTKNYSKHLGRFVEEILIRRSDDPTAAFNSIYWPNMTGVWDDFVAVRNPHEYQKPLSLMERLVWIYTNPGELVVDIYCGSGTTNQACLNLGRRSIGIDNNSTWINYCKEHVR